MPASPARNTSRGAYGRTTALALALAGSALPALLCPSPAEAHFILDAPACWSKEDVLGSPQKSAPCGQADPNLMVMPTGDVTTYRQGQTITLTVREAVFHPGHYRVAIAPDMDSLPMDPPVTAGATPCGTTVVDPKPTLPLLADGILDHTTQFSGAQTVQIQLPPDFTCDKCTLQVIEFMSSHPLNNPGGCFYHHCATVSVLPGTDGGTETGADGGMSAAPPADAAMAQGEPQPQPAGCDYPHQGAAPTAAAATALLLLALPLATRRRRAPSRS